MVTALSPARTYRYVPLEDRVFTDEVPEGDVPRGEDGTPISDLDRPFTPKPSATVAIVRDLTPDEDAMIRDRMGEMTPGGGFRPMRNEGLLEAFRIACVGMENLADPDGGTVEHPGKGATRAEMEAFIARCPRGFRNEVAEFILDPVSAELAGKS